MSDFVEECRREWKRLRVPAGPAGEMADDLAADLHEAEAEGAFPEEVLGDGAADPRAFAEAWARERGLVRPHWTDRLRTRRALLVGIGLVALLVLGAVLGSILSSRAGPGTPQLVPTVNAAEPGGRLRRRCPDRRYVDLLGEVAACRRPAQSLHATEARDQQPPYVHQNGRPGLRDRPTSRALRSRSRSITTRSRASSAVSGRARSGPSSSRSRRASRPLHDPRAHPSAPGEYNLANNGAAWKVKVRR